MIYPRISPLHLCTLQPLRQHWGQPPQFQPRIGASPNSASPRAAAHSPRHSRRTFKYLMGILTGAWVVDADWAAACLARCTPVEEGAFEVW